jgi:hypothetical protein
MMAKIGAFFHVAAGALFALAGTFVVYRCCWFLSAVPRDHIGAVTWAGIIFTIGLYLVIRGLGLVRFGTMNLGNQRRS